MTETEIQIVVYLHHGDLENHHLVVTSEAMEEEIDLDLVLFLRLVDEALGTTDINCNIVQLL